ncbi:MAG: LCP family protein [Elusimicrobiota bacterium]|nr:LCP family protein [Elusimicrobiota bacterium]
MKIKHLILIFLVGLILSLAYLSHKSVFINNNLSQKRTNFVLFGIDGVKEAVHSDTIILLSYSHKSGVMDLISIPRDLYVDVETLRYRKLAEVFAYFYFQKKDLEYAAKEVTNVLQNKVLSCDEGYIPVHYFLVIDYEKFKTLIDLLGKIKIVVTEPMHYDDFAGNLHIHFEPGIYHMDGKQVLEYVRYRDSVGDLGRISRQQIFIKALISKVLSPQSWYKIPILLFNLKKCFVTNINFWEFINMVLEFKNLKFTNLRFSTLPTRPKGRYLELEEITVQSLIDYLEDKQKEFVVQNRHIMLKIYNASGRQKLAKEVTNFMRDNGYDVIDWGNWYCKQPKSRIIDYTNNLKTVNSICELLNIYDITAAYTHTNSMPELQSTIIVILGEDFELPQTMLSGGRKN